MISYKLTDAQIVHIMEHHKNNTAKELATELQVLEMDIRNLCTRHGWVLKKAPPRKRKYRPVLVRPRLYSAYVPDPPKKLIKRWPAEYSNRTPFGIAKH